MLTAKDTQEYGDFALTKYYDPNDDIGLGASWEDIQGLIADDPGVFFSPILGETVGLDDSPFDPGKMGSYFQDKIQVEASYRRLLDLARESSSGVVSDALRMLTQAMRGGRGLYITF